MMTKKKQDKIVKKSNAIIRSQWQVSNVWEPRIVAILASKIHVDDKDFEVYKIPIAEIVGSGYSGRDLIHLETAIVNVMKHLITIQETSTKKSFYHVFSKCSLNSRKGLLELEFHPDLKPHYLQLKERFTQYSLAEFMSLHSIYSQRLYEILKSWSDKPEVDIAFEELCDMLDVPSSLRKNFAFLRRRVLEQAYKEIVEREGSSLWFDWEPIKKGQSGKVVAVHFVFNPAKAQELAKNQPQDEMFIHQKLQRESNKCFERIVIRGRKKCIPKNKEARCKYCLERGRMYAQQFTEQGTLPFDT